METARIRNHEFATSQTVAGATGASLKQSRVLCFRHGGLTYTGKPTPANESAYTLVAGSLQKQDPPSHLDCLGSPELHARAPLLGSCQLGLAGGGANPTDITVTPPPLGALWDPRPIMSPCYIHQQAPRWDGDQEATWQLVTHMLGRGSPACVPTDMIHMFRYQPGQELLLGGEGVSDSGSGAGGGGGGSAGQHKDTFVVTTLCAATGCIVLHPQSHDAKTLVDATPKIITKTFGSPTLDR